VAVESPGVRKKTVTVIRMIEKTQKSLRMSFFRKTSGVREGAIT
jgi:hypothetical protein